jgi:hypothetical protein
MMSYQMRKGVLIMAKTKEIKKEVVKEVKKEVKKGK